MKIAGSLVLFANLLPSTAVCVNFLNNLEKMILVLTSLFVNSKQGSYDFFIGKINILILFSSSTKSTSNSSNIPNTSNTANVNLSSALLTLNPSISLLAKPKIVVLASVADCSTVPKIILPSMWCSTSFITLYLGWGVVGVVIWGCLGWGCSNCSPNKKKVTAAVINKNKYNFKFFRTIVFNLWNYMQLWCDELSLVWKCFLFKTKIFVQRQSGRQRSFLVLLICTIFGKFVITMFGVFKVVGIARSLLSNPR